MVLPTPFLLCDNKAYLNALSDEFMNLSPGDIPDTI